MNSRPYLRKDVIHLEKLANDARRQLRLIRHELQFRKTMRAVELAAKIKAAVRALKLDR